MPARARCSALFTELTESPRSSATSFAGQPSTSRRISTARRRGARCWTATRYASSIVSRATADGLRLVPLVRAQLVQQPVRVGLQPGYLAAGRGPRAALSEQVQA